MIELLSTLDAILSQCRRWTAALAEEQEIGSRAVEEASRASRQAMLQSWRGEFEGPCRRIFREMCALKVLDIGQPVSLQLGHLANAIESLGESLAQSTENDDIPVARYEEQCEALRDVFRTLVRDAMGSLSG